MSQKFPLRVRATNAERSGLETGQYSQIPRFSRMAVFVSLQFGHLTLRRKSGVPLAMRTPEYAHRRFGREVDCASPRLQPPGWECARQQSICRWARPRCSRIELLVYEIANDGEAGDPNETLALCGHQVRTISERLSRCTLDRKRYVKIACRWPAAAATAQDGPSPRGSPAQHASLSVGS